MLGMPAFSSCMPLNVLHTKPWICATNTILRARCAGVRPVPLDIHVQGFDISNFESRMQVCFIARHQH